MILHNPEGWGQSPATPVEHHGPLGLYWKHTDYILWHGYDPEKQDSSYADQFGHHRVWYIGKRSLKRHDGDKMLPSNLCVIPFGDIKEATRVD